MSCEYSLSQLQRDNIPTLERRPRMTGVRPPLFRTTTIFTTAVDYSSRTNTPCNTFPNHRPFIISSEFSFVSHTIPGCPTVATRYSSRKVLSCRWEWHTRVLSAFTCPSRRCYRRRNRSAHLSLDPHSDSPASSKKEEGIAQTHHATNPRRVSPGRRHDRQKCEK